MNSMRTNNGSGADTLNLLDKMKQIKTLLYHVTFRTPVYLRWLKQDPVFNKDGFSPITLKDELALAAISSGLHGHLFGKREYARLPNEQDVMLVTRELFGRERHFRQEIIAIAKRLCDAGEEINQFLSNDGLMLSIDKDQNLLALSQGLFELARIIKDEFYRFGGADRPITMTEIDAYTSNLNKVMLVCHEQLALNRKYQLYIAENELVRIQTLIEDELNPRLALLKDMLQKINIRQYWERAILTFVREDNHDELRMFFQAKPTLVAFLLHFIDDLVPVQKKFVNNLHDELAYEMVEKGDEVQLFRISKRMRAAASDKYMGSLGAQKPAMIPYMFDPEKVIEKLYLSVMQYYETNPKEATLQVLLKCAQSRHALSLLKIGEMSLQGHGCEQSPETAYCFFLATYIYTRDERVRLKVRDLLLDAFRKTIDPNEVQIINLEIEDAVSELCASLNDEIDTKVQEENMRRDVYQLGLYYLNQYVANIESGVAGHENYCLLANTCALLERVCGDDSEAVIVYRENIAAIFSAIRDKINANNEKALLLEFVNEFNLQLHEVERPANRLC